MGAAPSAPRPLPEHARCPPYFAYRHSLARDFVWNLHLAFEPVASAVPPVAEPEDRFLWFLERTWWLHVLLLFCAIAAGFGLELSCLVVGARVAGSILGHWFVGYVAHKHGTVRYVVGGASEVGRNTWLLGVLSFGEGFHNNHHARPGSARMGEGPFELDLGFAVIRALEGLGLVGDVRETGRPGEDTLKPGARLSPRVKERSPLRSARRPAQAPSSRRVRRSMTSGGCARRA